MGGNVSISKVRNELQKYLSVNVLNELVQQIAVVMKSKNEIIFRNVAIIRNFKATFYNDVKNQIIADLILKTATKTDFYDEILNKIHEQQENSGMFMINANARETENIVKKYVDVSTVNRAIQNIREQFDIGNSFSVINDQLLPTSMIDTVDLVMTNQMFNKSVAKALGDMYEEIKDRTKDTTDDDFHQKADNSMVIIAIAIVGAIAGLAYLNTRKE